jgi:hypothetical protein
VLRLCTARRAAAPLPPAAGWELAQALLRPRSISVDGEGGVAFANDSAVPRVSASQALRHRFLRRAADPLALALARGLPRQLLRLMPAPMPALPAGTQQVLLLLLLLQALRLPTPC